MAKSWHMGPDGVEQDQTRSNVVKWVKMGSNRSNQAKRRQTEPNGPKLSKMGTNGEKRGQFGQNLFKDRDCPRDGDHPGDADHPSDGDHPRDSCL